jgi:phage-related protein
MASIYTLDFEYDDIPSQSYNVQIVNFGDGGLFSGIGSPDVTLHTQKVYRQDKEYFLGRSIDTPLQFPLTFASENVISGMDRSLIAKWLFGRSTYKKLKIIQDDLNGAWFNCIFINPEPYYVGNVNRGFKTIARCDSSFAYSPLKTETRTFTGNNVVQYDFVIYNGSDNDDYLRPNISFALNTVGSSFSITNADDDDYEFLFTGLQPSETITINAELETIVSSTGLLRLANFNKHWLRLKPGANHLHVESGIGTFTISYYERVAIGG